MSHPRSRFVQEKFIKRLKFNPVMTIQGARQTGKSFFARHFMQKKFPKAKYLTFDQDSVKESATRDIETFLERHHSIEPLIIDEAQKVPKLFDAIKFEVDQNRRPGRFILLGSTQFSRMDAIRESLTGRMSRVRMYPLTLAEAHQRKESVSRTATPFFLTEKPWLNRKDFMNHLEQGGLPGLFAVRSADERKSLLQDWVDLTIRRDVQMFPKIKADSELIFKILKAVAGLEEPSAVEVARSLRVDLRKVNRHIAILENLFVLERVAPFKLSTGKPLYYLFDSGLAAFLGANQQRLIETAFLQEFLAKESFELSTRPSRSLSVYRTLHKSRLSFVEENENVISAIQIYSEPPRKKTDFFILEGFMKTAKRELGSKQQINLYAFSPTLHMPNPTSVKPYLWESLG